MKVAASPQSINRAMPEGGIQVTSRWSLSASHPGLLIAAFTCLPLFIPYYYTTIGEGAYRTPVRSLKFSPQSPVPSHKSLVTPHTFFSRNG